MFSDDFRNWKDFAENTAVIVICTYSCSIIVAKRHPVSYLKFFTQVLWRSCNTAKRFATWVLTVIVLFTILKTCCYNLMIMTAAVMIDMFIYKWNTSLLQEQKFWFLITSCVQDMSMHFYYIIQLVNIRGCTKCYTHVYCHCTCYFYIF